MKPNKNSDKRFDDLARKSREALDFMVCEIQHVFEDVAFSERPLWQLHFCVNELHKFLFAITKEDKTPQ